MGSVKASIGQGDGTVDANSSRVTTSTAYDIAAFAPSNTRANTVAYTYATAHDWTTMRNRLSTILSRASKSDIIDGAFWYASYAPAIIDGIASRHGILYETVAAVMAVFSATCGWQANITATERFIDAYAAGARGRNLPAVVRNGHAMRKAEHIMNGADPETTIVKRGAPHVQSWKTLCFYYNLTGDTSRVTVDVWMWRAMSDDDKTQYRPEGWHYMMCESVIMSLAEENGMDGPALQAILWTVIRGSAH